VDETVKGVLCPCCKQLLCAIPFDSLLQQWIFAGDSPAVRRDSKGAYIGCGRCSRRIALTQSNSGDGPPFLVSAKQDRRAASK